MNIMINRLTIKYFKRGKDVDRSEKLGEAIRQFIRTDRLHKSLFDSIMARNGLHRNQHWALLYLHKNGAIGSQKQIAEHLGISSAAVAVMMKKLEKRGFIERRISECDSRNHTIRLTEEGESLLERTKCVFHAMDLRMLDGFTEAELETFIACQHKIYENLRTVKEEGGESLEVV